MKRSVLGILIVILLFILIFYPYFDSQIGNFIEEKETAKVLRIIDGDTIEVDYENNIQKVRLLGINTPEKGEKYYQEAKDFLNFTISNKTIILEKGKEDVDLYKRKLRYIYFNGENINEKLVINGYASVYYPKGNDWHTEKMRDDWLKCIGNNIFLCEKSINLCSSCIKLNLFDHEKEIIVLKNTCSFSCSLENWKIKDEGRKKFIIPKINLKQNEGLTIKVGNGTDSKNFLFWKNEKYVWTETGDTLFLRDTDDKLVLWDNY